MRDEQFTDAYRDAIRAVIGDQEEVGLDVLTDGHLWYDKHQGFIQSFILYNVERTGGIEIRPIVGFEAPESAPWMNVVNAVYSNEKVIIGKLERGPMRHAFNWSLAQSCTTKPLKAHFAAGPIGLANKLLDPDGHYKDRRAVVRDWAEIFRAEILDSVAAGASIVQFDDLTFSSPEEDWTYQVDVMNEILADIPAFTIWHACHGGTPSPVGNAPYTRVYPYAKELQVDAFEWAFAETGFPEEHLELFADSDKGLGMGAISVKNYVIETPEEVAAAIRKALRYVPAERLHLTTDCGIFAYSRPAAKAKLSALVQGSRIVREELRG
jgi:5-methyltetrahydropteroyltriglutamate--homocysteine methyltransferase